MHSSAGRRVAAYSLALAALALTVACAGSAPDPPPFAELPLRDALTADPSGLAALSDDAREALATRFEAARRSQEDAEPVPAGGAAPAMLIMALDEARAARGDDALVAATLGEGGEARVVHPLPGAVEGDAPSTLPPLVGIDTASTADLEERALHGHAGAVLGELLRASGAHRLVRVTLWPVGAAASGDAVYVNASWLVALAPAAGDAGAVRLVPRPIPAPVFQPLSLSGNPYLTYGSLAACAADVTARCATCTSSGACDAHPTLTDFPDAQSECAFLGQDPDRPLELCALALSSIGAVGDCLRAAGPTCALPSVATVSANLALAAAFVADAACAPLLDGCLSGAPAGASGLDVNLHVDGPSCEDPFTACASSFKGLDDACKSGSCTGTGNTSCASCSSCQGENGEKGCDSCGSGGSTTTSSSSSCSSCNTGGSTSSSSGSNCKCETRAPPRAPLGAIGWLLMPLAYALLRARRPS
jgi:hypothetical protein